MTEIEEVEIKKFKKMAAENKEIKEVISFVGCGIYHKNKKGDIENLDCLAVAVTHDNHWFGLGVDLKYYYFTPDEVA